MDSVACSSATHEAVSAETSDMHGPKQDWAVAADRLFDGERFLEDHAVWPKAEACQVLPAASLPPDLHVHREPDSTIIPGLIDTHVHFMRWQGPLYLLHGVTSIRDTGNDLRWIIDRRREWSSFPWPRILSLGPLIDGPEPNHPLVAWPVTDLHSAVDAVRRSAAAGVDGIKLYTAIEGAWLPDIVRESHAAGLRVSMHCLRQGVLIAGRAGVDEFYHHDGILADVWPEHPPGWLSVWGDPEFSSTWDRQRQVADEIAELGMTATPTLAYWDSQWRMRDGVGPSPAERQFVPPDLARWSSAELDPEGARVWRRALDAAQRFTGLLIDRQVPMTAGSDVPCGGIAPGSSLWRELTLLVESGMSVRQALRSATAAAADFLRQPRLGRLGKGRAGDLAVVRGDLSKGIPSRPEILLTARDGALYKRAELLSAAEQARPSFAQDPWGRQFEQHWRRQSS